jgi:hypothetical protein
MSSGGFLRIFFELLVQIVGPLGVKAKEIEQLIAAFYCNVKQFFNKKTIFYGLSLRYKSFKQVICSTKE